MGVEFGQHAVIERRCLALCHLAALDLDVAKNNRPRGAGRLTGGHDFSVANRPGLPVWP